MELELNDRLELGLILAGDVHDSLLSDPISHALKQIFYLKFGEVQMFVPLGIELCRRRPSSSPLTIDELDLLLGIGLLDRSNSDVGLSLLPPL